MLIAGISAFGENPGACLLRDGKLVAFAEEERFVRIKGARGRFPSGSLAYCLREGGVRLEDVERIAVGWDARKYRVQMPLFFAKTWWRHGRRHGSGSAHGTIFKEILDQLPGSITHRTTLALRRSGHAGRIPPLEFVPHHLAHAASTFFASGWEDAAVLIMDGSGEQHSASLFRGAGRGIREIEHIDMPDSLGWFYAAITAWLGFEPYQDEGFTMGLAPYGKPRPEIDEKLARVLKLAADGTYTVGPQYTLLGDHSLSEHFSDQLVALLGPPRLPGQPLDDHHRDVALAAQTRLEQAALGLTRRVTDGGKVRKLCLAGGVALNCKMNGVLAHSEWVDDVFVQPCSSDGGTALGAAMWLSAQSGEDPRFRMEHAQWGPAFGADAVRKTLDVAGLKYTEPPSIEEKAAEAISQGKVVAWFQGRMEAGARALGGRSILADATAAGMNDTVNAKVKFRDPWRPFCPSMTAEGTTFLDRPTETRFMTVAYDVRDGAREKIPSVIHVDGTTRPQTVRPDVLPRYHGLIQAVARKSGLPVVLNTSLNVKGEPIACTPQDAIRCFYTTGMEGMALEGFWVEKS